MRAAAAARLNDADEEEQRDRVIGVGKRRDRGGKEAKGGVNEDRGTCAEIYRREDGSANENRKMARDAACEKQIDKKACGNTERTLPGDWGRMTAVRDSDGERHWKGDGREGMA